MIRAAMMIAVRDVIRSSTAFVRPESEIEIVPPPGNPHGRAGDWFVSIVEGPMPLSLRTAFVAVPSITIIVSMKANSQPYDRLHNALYVDPDGMSARVGKIVSVLHKSQMDVMAKMREQLGANFNAMAEAPLPLNVSAIMGHSAQWWGTENEPQAGKPFGYHCQITYGGAKIIQYSDTVTG